MVTVYQRLEHTTAALHMSIGTAAGKATGFLPVTGTAWLALRNSSCTVSISTGPLAANSANGTGCFSRPTGKTNAGIER